MGYVYLVTNTINGKQYVGKTMKSVERRWRSHCKGGDNTPIQNAIRKYGVESFTVETLYETNDENVLAKAEQICIEELGTRRPEGYNLTAGGEGVLGLKHTEETKKAMSVARTGHVFSEEHNRKISESRNGITFSDETKRKMSEAKKGKPSSFKGKKHSEESNRRNREANLRTANSEEMKTKRKLTNPSNGDLEELQHRIDELEAKVRGD